MGNKGFFAIPPGENSKALVWIAVKASDFLNSWVNYVTVSVPASYAKDERMGLVYLRGIISTGTINTNAFVLPFGYRPLYQYVFATISNAAIGRLDVKPDGSVLPQAGNNTYFSLNGIVFSVMP